MSASGSLFTATITLLEVMPARCWIAPEIPSAMYRSGDTVFPVWPTCSSFGRQPASVTAQPAAAGDDDARLRERHSSPIGALGRLEANERESVLRYRRDGRDLWRRG